MPKTSAELIADHDREKRMGDETIILQKAHSLTNGSAGDEKLQGEVMLWMVEETISQGKMLRKIAQELVLFQLKSECELSRKKKTWAVRIFGFNFSTPITTGVVIIGWLIFMAAKKQGWM